MGAINVDYLGRDRGSEGRREGGNEMFNECSKFDVVFLDGGGSSIRVSEK